MKIDLTGYPRPIRPRDAEHVQQDRRGRRRLRRRDVAPRRIRRTPLHARAGAAGDARQSAARHGPGDREGVHQPHRHLPGGHAGRARHLRAGHRARGEPDPGNALAARSFASSATRRATCCIPGRSSTSPSRTRTACSCARSSRRRIPSGMASGSATISSDAIARRFAAAARAPAGARSSPTSRPAIRTRERSVALLQGLEDAGADVIEVGVPFSDPMADGPVIQASSQRRSSRGCASTRCSRSSSTRRARRSRSCCSAISIPLLAAATTRCGARPTRARTACSSPTCRSAPIRSARRGSREARSTSSGSSRRRRRPTRMGEIAATGSGFVYLISRLGVTGERSELPPELPDDRGAPACGDVAAGVRRLRHLAPEQARAVARIADGVVVGSAHRARGRRERRRGAARWPRRCARASTTPEMRAFLAGVRARSRRARPRAAGRGARAGSRAGSAQPTGASSCCW